MREKRQLGLNKLTFSSYYAVWAEILRSTCVGVVESYKIALVITGISLGMIYMHPLEVF